MPTETRSRHNRRESLRREFAALKIGYAWRRFKLCDRSDCDPITLVACMDVPLNDLWVFWDSHTHRWRACNASAWLEWFSIRSNHPLVPHEEISSTCIRSCAHFCKMARHRRALSLWVRSQTMRDMRASWWRSIHRQNRDGMSAHVRVNTMLLSLGMHFSQFASAFDM